MVDAVVLVLGDLALKEKAFEDFSWGILEALALDFCG